MMRSLRLVLRNEMKITPILSDGGQQESENEYRFLANRLIAVVVILLFGRGKISDLMGDVARASPVSKKACARMKRRLKNPPLMTVIRQRSAKRSPISGP